MKVLLVLAALIFVVIYCIKFAARQVDAKSGTGAILLCLLAQAALTELSRHVAMNAFVQFVAAFAGGALIYSVILSTTFKKGIVISLLSSGMIVLGMLLVIGVAGLTMEHDDANGQASLKEMQSRAAQSQWRDHGYNDVANRALLANQSEVHACLPESGPPENFVAYLEILPDGSVGKSRFEPLTDVGKCLREVAARHRFPTPPGTYVVTNKMVFERRS